LAGKAQRVRDPIHGLFDKGDRDQLAWDLINAKEFQRLRRIRQLGFSELVFPGATHTRFSHCVGAFHNARRLLEIIKPKLPGFDEGKAFSAAIAALLHDLGHGPFSHVFESVQRARGQKRRHEDWTADIIKGDSEIHKVLDNYDSHRADEIADILTRRDPISIYDSIVSSQFDADRLDYLQRDRYMSGIGTGGFDFAWLLDCLEAGKITIGSSDGDFVEVDGLHLNHKGLQAAEGYLLARFHLYLQVYLHKTTRSAEKMLSALLQRAGALVAEGKLIETGLPQGGRLLLFLQDQAPTLDRYLTLDDTVIWSAIGEMSDASDQRVASLARRLQSRKLFKCVDVGDLAERVGGDSLPAFKKKLGDQYRNELGINVLVDDVPLTAYGTYDYEDRGALQKVLIGRHDGSDRTDDIASRSDVVSSIGERRIFRVYGSDEDMVARLQAIWEEVKK
jgi:HD superfamily phosphohydrolase